MVQINFKKIVLWLNKFKLNIYKDFVFDMIYFEPHKKAQALLFKHIGTT